MLETTIGWVAMIKRLNSFYQARKKNIETKLIGLICLFLLMIFISFSFMYYNMMLSMYSDQLVKSNERILDQVVIAFESVTKQTTDSIYKIPLNDKDLRKQIREYGIEPYYKKEIVEKIDSITLGNEYLAWACLYIPKHDIIFDAYTGNSSSLEFFYDQEALADYGKGKIYVLDPRLVDNGIKKQLLMTVVCPIPIPATMDGPDGVLIVYIDVNKLYYGILNKIEVQDNMNFFVYNNDNTIVIHKNQDALFTKFALFKPDNSTASDLSVSGGFFKKSMKISSFRYSKLLKWNFVLENSVETPGNYLGRIYSFAAYFTVILLISVLAIVMIIKYSVKPIKKVMSGYDESLWKDFLTGNGEDSEELKRLLSTEHFNEKTEYCALALFQIMKSSLEPKSVQHYIESIHNFCDKSTFISHAKAIAVSRNHIAVILYFKREELLQSRENGFQEFISQIYDSLNPDFKPATYISASLPKDSLNLLAMAYMECMEALNYKIFCNSHVLQYAFIKDKKQWSEYPYDIERQLINNIIVGNIGACEFFIDKFFESLTKPEFRIRDSEFQNCIYQLQAVILRNLSGLPLSYRLDFNIDIMQLFELQKIKDKLLEAVGKIAYMINKKDENDEYVLYKKVFEYIDKNFTNEDFNLNKAADDLNLNRNYLTRIVKEKTGENFNDYINTKRIFTAKQLMQETEDSIETITHKVGFNYSHYFIKVFKKIEGVTPGQYREKANKPLSADQ